MSVSNEDTPDPLELKLVRALGRPGQWCWKVYSDRLDRVLWIARDAASAALLIQSADEPVLFQDDLDDLESLAPDVDDRRLNARLDALAAARKTPPAPGEEEDR